MRPRVQSPSRGPTDRGFWGKSRLIFKAFYDNATQSIRQVAQQTGLSKSSVHRLTRAMERRARYPESGGRETADGRQWFARLVVATLYPFGLKRGVGVDTMRTFFARLHLETQVGCSPLTLLYPQGYRLHGPGAHRLPAGSRTRRGPTPRGSRPPPTARRLRLA